MQRAKIWAPPVNLQKEKLNSFYWFLSGSCLPKFSPMPFVFCNLKEVCHFSSRNDYSFWLSTGKPMNQMMTPMTGNALREHISRCAVCESPSQLMAVHSQDSYLPECPVGWAPVWAGYSFAMASQHEMAWDILHPFSTQRLALKELAKTLNRPAVVLRSSTPSRSLNAMAKAPATTTPPTMASGLPLLNRSLWSTDWLFILPAFQQNQFRKPMPQTLKAGGLKDRVSRCQVCVKNRQ